MWYDVCMRGGREFQHWCKVQDARCSVRAAYIRAASVDLIFERQILKRQLTQPLFTLGGFAKLPLLWRWHLLRTLILSWLLPATYVMPLLKASVRGLLRTGYLGYLPAIIRTTKLLLLALWPLYPLGFAARRAIYECMHEDLAGVLHEKLRALATRVATLSRLVIAFLATRIHSLEVVDTPLYYRSRERFFYPPPEPLVLIPTIQPNAPSA